MSGNNEYLKKRKERDAACFQAGLRTGMQIEHDFITMALRHKETMGKDVFGRKRLDKVFGTAKALDEYFHIAFSKHNEADKKQQEMDDCLREVYGDELIEFPERYPYVKQYSYDRAQKGWVK